MFLQNICNFQYFQEAQTFFEGGCIYLPLSISKGRNSKMKFYIVQLLINSHFNCMYIELLQGQCTNFVFNSSGKESAC